MAKSKTSEKAMASSQKTEERSVDQPNNQPIDYSSLNERAENAKEHNGKKLSFEEQLAAEQDARIQASNKNLNPNPQPKPEPEAGKVISAEEAARLEALANGGRPADDLPPGNSGPNDPSDEDPEITVKGVKKKLSEWQKEIDENYSKAAATVTRVSKPLPEPELTEEQLAAMTAAIQTGTPAEAAKGIREIMKLSASAAKKQSDEEQQRVEFITKAQQIYTKYDTIAKNQNLFFMMQGIERSLMNKVFDPNNRVNDAVMRLEEAFSQTKKQLDAVRVPEKNKEELAEIERKKAAAAVIPGTSSRSVGSVTKQLSEREANQLAIENERKARAGLRA